MNDIFEKNHTIKDGKNLLHLIGVIGHMILVLYVQKNQKVLNLSFGAMS